MPFRICCILFFIFHGLLTFAQSADNHPFIKLVQPLKEDNAVSSSQQFIIGSTCKGCTVTINDTPIKVYRTGAFAYEVNLKLKENSFTIIAAADGKQKKKTIKFVYTIPSAPQPVRDFKIEYVQTSPAGDLLLQPGDLVQFKVKTLTHCMVKVNGDTKLFEQPDSLMRGISGIYYGSYVMKATDTFYQKPMIVTVQLNDSAVLYRPTPSKFTMFHPDSPHVVITKGRLAHLEYGLGDDRLGGAKIGYIDSLIPLQVIGKVGGDFKIKLCSSRTAYIPEEHVKWMPPGSPLPESLTGKIKLTKDSLFDYVTLQLFSRLPYQTFHQTDPSRIVVDVFGATNNTNWIDQPEAVKEIKKIEYEQIADGIYRMTISLNQQQHWGHAIYYNANNLVIRVKRPPLKNTLSGLTIALDAGHGGTNTGAVGATGTIEKDLTLQLTRKIKTLLDTEGAKVILTRDKEMFFDNKERILFYRDSTPDLLLSIHLNSATDPFRSSGTSTFYRYEGFRPLSRAIYKRMLELGLKEYGNNGSFNFMLNSPIEYPNALIETLFLSNLEEEEKILDPVFQEQVAEKIVQGVKDFVEEGKKVQ